MYAYEESCNLDEHNAFVDATCRLLSCLLRDCRVMPIETFIDIQCRSICLRPDPLQTTYNEAEYMHINWKEYLGYFLAIYNPIAKYIEFSDSSQGVELS